MEKYVAQSDLVETAVSVTLMESTVRGLRRSWFVSDFSIVGIPRGGISYGLGERLIVCHQTPSVSFLLGHFVLCVLQFAR